MKKIFPKKLFLFLVAVGLILLGFNNCSKVDFKDDLAEKAFRSGETIVGNPMTAAAKTALAKLCALVASCHPTITAAACETEMLGQGVIDWQLGLTKGSYPNYADIIQSEASGQLTANASAALACFSGINQIKCSDPLAQSAYNESTGSFAGMAFLIPTTAGSCPAIFNQPPTLLEYYVAVNGDDQNDGSVDHPWASLTHASQALSLGAGGTTVHVAPGSYTLPVTTNCSSNGSSCGVKTERSGSASAKIRYISDQAGAAQINAPGASILWYNSGDYIEIVGFELAGNSSANFGILSEAAFGQMIGNHIHHIPVTNGCAKNSAGGGIFFGYLPSAHDNNAIANRIHDIGPRLPDGLPQSSYCRGLANGISYDQPRGKAQNNIIYSVDSYAIATWHQASNLQISHNLLFHNGARAADGTAVEGAIYISGETNVGVHDQTTVSNNIIRNNSGKGISEYVSVGANNLYVNNILYANGQDFDLNSGSVLSGTISSDPLMVDFRLDGSGDYHLTSASPAIDSGTLNCASATGTGQCTPDNDILGVLRPLGSSLDIGPYEWHP